MNLINKTLMVGVSLSLYSCAPNLTVRTVDSQTQESIEGVRIKAKGDEQRIPDEELTDVAGLAKFPDIKSTPIEISASLEDEYFPLDTKYEDVSLKNAVVLKLEKLQTIVIGKVEEDTTWKPIDSCMIKTEPHTETVYSDDQGRFVIRSTKFKDSPYDIIATHEEYFTGKRSAQRFTINDKNNVGVIILTPKPKKKRPDVEEIETKDQRGPGRVDTE